MSEVGRRTLAGTEPLEWLYWPQSESAERTPLLFVHGAYVGAWCWAEHFIPWFGALGHPVGAVSLRGHGKSAGRDRLHGFSVADYAEDLAVAVAACGRSPVLIGHSMGASVVQKYLERGAAPAAAFLCPVPSTGLLAASWSLAFTRPTLFAGINAMAMGGRPSIEAVREALFAGAVPADAMERYYARMQPESRRALMDLSGWGLPQRSRMNLPPALVLAAEHDVLIPRAQVEFTARHLDAEYGLLAGLGHVLMLDAGWELAALALRDWLAGRGI